METLDECIVDRRTRSQGPDLATAEDSPSLRPVYKEAIDRCIHVFFIGRASMLVVALVDRDVVWERGAAKRGNDR